jgi:hypothetical protein
MDTSEKDRDYNRYKTLRVDERSHLAYAQKMFYLALRQRAPDAMAEVD